PSPVHLPSTGRLENTQEAEEEGGGSRIEKAMEESNSYEEQRRRQIEENRRKLDELRLHHLSAAVREAAARPKPNPNPKPRPVRQILSLLPSLPPVFPLLFSRIYDSSAASVSQKRKAPGPGELRRSGRVAGLPEQPNYLKGAQQRDDQGVYAAYDARIWKGPTDEERAAAVAKAEELQRRIHRIRRPAFVKTMTHVCASRAKQMMIPKHFIEHLPAHDEAVVLVDQADDEFHMMCNASKEGRHCYLSKGWREFAVHHDLENGDCLVFQLIDSAKFKVYIFRANPDYESDQTSDDSEDEQ
uniref:TF-B3 domain-containing protein n=1 Tax=Aegilops tauschii subsp. strangulata TaxID=200361 RepID=A0A453MDT5_AEGTS